MTQRFTIRSIVGNTSRIMSRPPSLFSVGRTLTAGRALYCSSAIACDPEALERTVPCITAVLLGLEEKPVIRYELMRPIAKKLGLEIQICLNPMCANHILSVPQDRMQSEASLFDFRRPRSHLCF